MDVSIIIVNYNTKDCLYNCIDSIYKNTKEIEFEIVVSDNGSTDGSIEMILNNFPAVVLLKNNENLGFGSANNRGLKKAKGRFIFYLNSDTILLNNAVKQFYDYWAEYTDKEHLGALGCNLINKKNIVVHSCGKFSQLYDDIKMFFKEYIHLLFFFIDLRKNDISQSIIKHTGETDVIVGADLFLKNDDNAFFDERFFLYHEEEDLELQLSRKCKKRIIIDGPQIIHLEGKSDETFKPKDRYSRFNSFSRIHDFLSKVKYHRKNNNNPIGIFLLKFVVLLIWLYPVNFTKSRFYLKDLFRA